MTMIVVQSLWCGTLGLYYLFLMTNSASISANSFA
jgi:hypothetical protein